MQHATDIPRSSWPSSKNSEQTHIARQASARTAIVYAAGHGYTDTAKALEQFGADPRRGDAKGLNAIMYAKASGYTETAQMLDASGQEDSARAVCRPVPTEPGAAEPATHTPKRQNQGSRRLLSRNLPCSRCEGSGPGDV